MHAYHSSEIAAGNHQRAYYSRLIFCRQLRALTVANLKSRYRKTWAGFLWVVLNPLIMYGVQSQVFSRILKLQIPNYALFLLSGLLPWIFITQSLEMCTSIFVNSGRLLKAFPVHPLVYLAAQLVDNLINFLAAFLLVLLPLCIFNPGKCAYLILLPIPIFTLGVGVMGMAWLLATTQVFFRDTRYILSFVLSISFFLTPVFYPVGFIPEKWQWLLYANPFYHLIAPFRVLIYDFNPGVFGNTTLKALAVATLAFAAAAGFWRRRRNEIYFNL